MTADHLLGCPALPGGHFDTFGGAKARFLKLGLAPLSINPEHTRDFNRGNRRVDFTAKFNIKTPILSTKLGANLDNK